MKLGLQILATCALISLYLKWQKLCRFIHSALRVAHSALRT